MFLHGCCAALVDLGQHALASPTAADADIRIKFYDLRREAEMRKARNWFGMWVPQSFDDFMKISMNFTAPENA